MNRNQRKYGRLPKTNDDHSNEQTRYEIEEVFPPKSRRNGVKIDVTTANRCCLITPPQKDESQITEYNGQCYIDPEKPDTIQQLKDLKKLLCSETVKSDKSSQYMEPNKDYFDSRWQNVDSIKDIEQIFGRDQEKKRTHIEEIHITETPRIKVIAEKYSKLKQKDIEVRKLKEKIVCLEYDIFGRNKEQGKPVQTMRAYFSLTPTDTENSDKILPPPLENRLITDQDLEKNHEEIEIIEGKLKENRPYIDDLKKVLKQKRVTDPKNKNNIDLKILYEIAQGNMDKLPNVNLFSKDELKGIATLILKKSQSGHAIRRVLMRETDIAESERDGNIDYFFDELTKLDV